MRQSMPLATLLLAATASAQAPTIVGIATVTDGDTMQIRGTKIRLFGIDAPESSQTCTRNGQTYGCGRESANQLAALIAGKNVSCFQKDIDRYGRMVAVCRVGNTDLNRLLVERGLALPYIEYGGGIYADAHRQAVQQGRGLHAGTYQLPWNYRKDPNTPPTNGAAQLQPAKPAATPRPAPTPKPAAAAPTPASSTVYYANCSVARAAGAAPLRRGQPGYRPAMDRDGDGVACE